MTTDRGKSGDATRSGATYRDPVSNTAIQAPSVPERTRSGAEWLYAFFGVLAAAFGVAIGTLVAALIDPAYAPIEVVASTAIDLPPQAVKEWATPEEVLGDPSSVGLRLTMWL